MSTLSTVVTRGLVKEYGGRRVVDNVDISLTQGEIVGLLGPNGAGKSTTFNMVVGLVRPNAGKVLLDGVDITAMPVHHRALKGLGYLAQDRSIFTKLTVEQNIMAILETTGLNRTQRRERMDMLLEELGVAHVRKSKAYQLSGGERRRVEIARALVKEPRFILLDEPFAAIDPKAVEEIQDIVYQMKRRGLGVLITDHSVRETLTVTDRTYIIYEGKVMMSGTARELVESPEARKYYLGERFYMDTTEDLRKQGPVAAAAPPSGGVA